MMKNQKESSEKRGNRMVKVEKKNAYLSAFLAICVCLLNACINVSQDAKQGLNVVAPPALLAIPAATEARKNRKPIVQSLLANPIQVVKKDDIITFKVVAFDEDSDVLKHVWSATKGTISTTQGEVVSWMPQKSDGSLEEGVAIISVLVSDNKGGTDTSAVNITIESSGKAVVAGTLKAASVRSHDAIAF